MMPSRGRASYLPKRVWTAAMRKHRQDLARMLRLTLIKQLGGVCKWCIHCSEQHVSVEPERNCTVTDPDILQFAHVHGKETGLKGSGRGQYYRLKDVFDHPDCYVLLCVDHHKEYDREK